MFSQAEWLPLWKYAKMLGPLGFRNMMAETIPVPSIKRMRELVIAVEKEAVKILEEKKAALKAGNAKLIEQAGEGKDIMSLLRE